MDLICTSPDTHAMPCHTIPPTFAPFASTPPPAAQKLEEGRWFSPATFLKNVRHVVLDEVDVTLLGHEAASLKLLDRLRADDHRRVAFMAMVCVGGADGFLSGGGFPSRPS